MELKKVPSQVPSTLDPRQGTLDKKDRLKVMTS